MQWYNEPPRYSVNGNTITVTAGAKTDFWQKTHYGFQRDNGHFYYQTVLGDFEAGVKIIGQYHALYDQAGMMVRLDAANWIKTGIEYVNGVQNASAVVTREFSDWSVLPMPHNPPALWLRVKREGDAVEISTSTNGVTYNLLRLAYFPTVEAVQVGLMVAAPDGDGFEVTFEDYFCQPKTP